MSLTKLFLLLVSGSLLMTACKSKKTPVLSGDEPVAVSDFIEFFPVLTLGYQVGDTLLDKKEKDYQAWQEEKRYRETRSGFNTVLKGILFLLLFSRVLTIKF